ncbi:MAG: transposase [Moorea sp. SIO4G2]|nr:transposase [Moorena sp. SIO4G2]
MTGFVVRLHSSKVSSPARCVIRSNDLVAYVRAACRRQDLRVKNLIKNHCLAKSINDAGWYQFREWLEYFGQKFGRITVAVNPAYTSQNCSNCGEVVKKSLSTRTHSCKCGCQLDRDHNAAKNILTKALSTVGFEVTVSRGSPLQGTGYEKKGQNLLTKATLY